MTPEHRSRLIAAIGAHKKVQLGYKRRDGSTSLHIIAPIDLQPGDQPSNQHMEYLWAFCFAEDEAEMHLGDRILTVRVLDEVFDVSEVLAAWPAERWPLPNEWRIPRAWNKT